MTKTLHLTWPRALLLLGLLSPASCFALSCTLQGSGSLVASADLGSTVAIPASAPNGTVVWRSEPVNLAVDCARGGQPGPQEEIYIHLNPAHQVVGQGIRVGLSHEGVDHRQSNGRIATGRSVPACVDVQACGALSFNLGFSVFIEKFGPTPPSGVASRLQDYRLFQLDGGSGPGPLGDSLNYVINNLGGLRFVACDAQLQVIPDTVDFGRIAIQNVVVGQVAERRPFALHTSRTCDSAFSLDARLKPVSGTLAGELLIPSGNDGVGIRIVRAGGGVIPYNRSFHLAELLGDTQAAMTQFDAELLWHSAQPKAGPFSAGVVVDLFYK
ncbi:pilus assembly protein [Pseudomonas gingeri NCPPB 3146 = LMG 5327]|uniref:Fimbrial protein n=2 Tax=Pseudomonas gingeri TaxID=117681 RepID=A0A7Y8CGD3_9PSED|nr:fimbrial protein [Pseudomonas gingeri]NWC17126.1 fimbrial protein [Pseudomonas gingeri]NWE44556.1 fimbrial protein [Pseudomonas gingeri]NWE70878.1 fimbrial protein [Pseudomonas gingeri]PNQ92044.1 pilus assembly protein [Pseudomonas gingeri NCPPB 3146 = LMG 5327]